MDSNIKLSNVIGAPFQSFVLTQLDQRANHNSSTDRNLNEVLFLANKTAWVRVASSVNVIGRTLEQVNESEKTSTLKNVTSKQVYEALGTGTYGAEDDLAKGWVLEAGTSVQVGDGITLRKGISTANATGSLNTTLGAYGLGGTTELGFVPMPGLTSVTIETLGRLGSLRQANINFRVNNLNQLNVIEALYFRLGYSMILEWGHTQYYLNDGSFERKNIYGISDIFNENLRKEDIITKINSKTRETNGNYGGMYGIVTGFNWNATQDGGYDCTLKLIGHGAIMDSLKANQSYTLPAGEIEQFEKFEDFILKQIAINQKLAEELKNRLSQVSNSEIIPIEPSDAPLTSIPKAYELIKKYQYNNSATYTYKDYVQEYGYPIPDKNVFIPVQGSEVLYNLDVRKGQDDFVVYVPDFPWVKQPDLRAGLIKKFTGYYIQNGSQFLRKAERDKLGGTLNLTELNSQLWWARAIVRDYGGNPEVGYFGEVQPNKALSDPLINKVLIAAAGNQFGSSEKSGKNVPIPQSNGGVFVADITAIRSTITDSVPEWPLNGLVESAKYGKRYYDFEQKVETFTVGGYSFRLQVNVGANFQYYQPTVAQISDAFTKWLGGGNLINFGTLELEKESQSNAIYPVFPNVYRIKGSVAFTVPNVPYSGPSAQAVDAAKVKGYSLDNNVAPEVPVILTILTTNLSVFSNFTINGKTYDVTGNATGTAKTGDKDTTLAEVNTTQVKSPEGFSSALQAMLTIVQAEAQAAALKKTGVYVHDILKTTRKFYTDGALNNVFNEAGNTTAPDLSTVKGEKFTEFKLLNYAIKGFNSSIMANNSLDVYNNILPVDFKTLCKAYVIKYKQGGLEGAVNDVRSPTFITLGYLLAFLNNMCLIYDSNQSRKIGGNSVGTKKHPFLYIDFNPKTNFCLTSPQQFSIDPTVCMIPMQNGQDNYKKLFPTQQIITNLKPAVFNPDKFNVVSTAIENAGANFTEKGQKNSAYRGNLMNILINTQYLLDLCLNMSRNDPEHAVNLKPFLDQILIDVNKSLGGINSFRVSYVDDSNVIQIVDDQWVPLEDTVLNQKEQAAKDTTTPTTSGKLPLDGSVIATPDAPGSISIVGTKSITREFRLNTVISSKLASKIAISAQAETGSVNSKDHSAYSHLNTYYEDRYSRSKEDPTIGNTVNVNKKGDTSDQEVANLFNSHIICLYSEFNGYNPKNIETAKNYYLERMSKVKSSNPLTSASPYIPLELELTVDGISGIVMGNAFTVPNDRLPVTYRGEGGKTKIAFIVTGLVHTIQQNEWLTKIKGQMIKLKTPVLIETAAKRADSIQTSLNTLGTLDEFNRNYPWSAGFISYVMREAGISNFPVNSFHSLYAQALRSKPNGFEVLDPSKTIIQVGDLVVANRGNTLTFSTPSWSGTAHGDIITAISGDTATGVGGNVSQSVAAKSIGLSNGKLGKSDYFVVLRPPQDKVTSIVNTVLAEYNLWKKNNWKETNPDALPYLRKYYKIIGITI